MKLYYAQPNQSIKIKSYDINMSPLKIKAGDKDSNAYKLNNLTIKAKVDGEHKIFNDLPIFTKTDSQGSFYKNFISLPHNSLYLRVEDGDDNVPYTVSLCRQKICIPVDSIAADNVKEKNDFIEEIIEFMQNTDKMESTYQELDYFDMKISDFPFEIENKNYFPRLEVKNIKYNPKEQKFEEYKES